MNTDDLATYIEQQNLDNELDNSVEDVEDHWVFDGYLPSIDERMQGWQEFAIEDHIYAD